MIALTEESNTSPLMMYWFLFIIWILCNLKEAQKVMQLFCLF